MLTKGPVLPRPARPSTSVRDSLSQFIHTRRQRAGRPLSTRSFAKAGGLSVRLEPSPVAQRKTT